MSICGSAPTTKLMKPSHIHREQGTVASFWCLDGAIDELKIYNRALSLRQECRQGIRRRQARARLRNPAAADAFGAEGAR
jgi:hypothetical protein